MNIHKITATAWLIFKILGVILFAFIAMKLLTNFSGTKKQLNITIDEFKASWKKADKDKKKKRVKNPLSGKNSTDTASALDKEILKRKNASTTQA